MSETANEIQLKYQEGLGAIQRNDTDTANHHLSYLLGMQRGLFLSDPADPNAIDCLQRAMILRNKIANANGGEYDGEIKAGLTD